MRTDEKEGRRLGRQPGGEAVRFRGPPDGHGRWSGTLCGDRRMSPGAPRGAAQNGAPPPPGSQGTGLRGRGTWGRGLISEARVGVPAGTPSVHGRTRDPGRACRSPGCWTSGFGRDTPPPSLSSPPAPRLENPRTQHRTPSSHGTPSRRPRPRLNTVFFRNKSCFCVKT